MPWFFKKNNSPQKRENKLTESQKIELVNSAYAEFEKKFTALEEERNAKIAEILKIIDERKIHDILRRVDQKQ